MTGNLLKKSSGFILLCSISLLMLVMTGCQEAKLKTVIAVANKQCPIDMGAVGTITSIIYDGNNVVYTLNMNEEITNIKILKDNPETESTNDLDRKSTRLNSSHNRESRMPSSA